jgi:hypothetical protein
MEDMDSDAVKRWTKLVENSNISTLLPAMSGSVMTEDQISDGAISPLKQKYLQTRLAATQKDHLRAKFREQCLQRAKDLRLQTTFEARLKNARKQQNTNDQAMSENEAQIRQLVQEEYCQLALTENEDDQLSTQDLEDVMAFISQSMHEDMLRQGMFCHALCICRVFFFHHRIKLGTAFWDFPEERWNGAFSCDFRARFCLFHLGFVTPPY